MAPCDYLVAAQVLVGLSATEGYDSNQEQVHQEEARSYSSTGSLSYWFNNALPKFSFENSDPSADDRVGMFPQGKGPGSDGDSTYVAWQYISQRKGDTLVDQDLDNCLPAGMYDAYSFAWGFRASPFAGPVSFYYPGNSKYQKCSDGRCISADEPCEKTATLVHRKGSTPPTFDYTNPNPKEDNWVGFFAKGEGPGYEGDGAALRWNRGANTAGVAVADQDMDKCLPAGEYDGWYFEWGVRRPALVGPVPFYYAGNPDYKKCGDRCVPVNEFYGCPSDQQECDGKCIAKDEACRKAGEQDCNGTCVSGDRACCKPGEQDCNGCCVLSDSVCCSAGEKDCNGKCVGESQECCKSWQQECNGQCINSDTKCCKSWEMVCAGECIPADLACCKAGEKSCNGRCIGSDKTCCQDSQKECEGKCIDANTECKTCKPWPEGIISAGKCDTSNPCPDDKLPCRGAELRKWTSFTTKNPGSPNRFETSLGIKMTLDFLQEVLLSIVDVN